MFPITAILPPTQAASLIANATTLTTTQITDEARLRAQEDYMKEIQVLGAAQNMRACMNGGVDACAG